MKVFKGNLRVRGFTKEDNEERYKSHKVLRKEGILYNPRKRRIFNCEKNETVKLLITKYGYIIENDLIKE